MSTRTGEGSHLALARASHNGTDNKALYKEWAANYNADLPADVYIAPMLTAQAALRFFDSSAQSAILDAGCGTGLVAEVLARGGAQAIDGLDLSPAMLAEAGKTGIYQQLFVGDLTRPVDVADERYDIVTCAGTFTHGHVGPAPALREFVRIVKTAGGVVVATIIDAIWESGGFKREIEAMEAEGLVRIVSADIIDYVQARGDHAVLIVLEKLSPAGHGDHKMQSSPAVLPTGQPLLRVRA
ncbi:S-adenosyl-L-methionine-dependent methyltransferase [Apiospora phragmitis]|uniref:S-adenosyl-L-methionine-dependent methyltransferase n=1 Tax=Apiospora phragmitis TaxID=2905665 RepID=A0ABR1VG68_9PEZI